MEIAVTNKKRHVKRFVIVSGIAFLLDATTGFNLIHNLLGYKPPIRPKPKRTESTGGR
jgi:hypothetical protein